MARSSRRQPSAPAVQVTVRGGPFRGVHRDVLRRRAAKMLAALELADVELSIAVVDDRTMRELNRRYRRRNRPTDVLAFSLSEGEPLADGPEGPRLLGDVVISAETARRQARSRRRRLLDELTTLLAHGLLHLLGYDHRSRREERAMDARRLELEQAAARPRRR